MTCKTKVSCRGREINEGHTLHWVCRKELRNNRYTVHLLLPILCSLPILRQVLMGLDLRPSGWHSRMFWGLRSRWRMPLLCRTFMAWPICCRNTRMVSSLSVPLAECQRDNIHKTTREEVGMAVYRRFIMLHGM